MVENKMEIYVIHMEQNHLMKIIILNPFKKDETISIKNSCDVTIQDGLKANSNLNDEENGIQHVSPEKPQTPVESKSFQNVVDGDKINKLFFKMV